MVDSGYDEDLADNCFYKELKTNYEDLIVKATVENWVISIPRDGSFSIGNLAEQDIHDHILIPDSENRQYYKTLSGKHVTVLNKVITVDDSSITHAISAHIIFEETFYINESSKYKVWCIEYPLSYNTSFQAEDICNLQTLKDCVDLLWNESIGKDITILEHFDKITTEFLINNSLEKCSLQTLKELVCNLYIRSLQDIKVSERTINNKNLMKNVRLSVETYIQHRIYKQLFNAISVNTARDDAAFNKTVRNLTDYQLRDLDIRTDLYESVPFAKRELAKINMYGTILGKISCLKNSFNEISRTESLTVDELLPVVVFLILKTGVANWIANLVFMKNFRYNLSSEYDYLSTTLEAAIEHIRSGALMGPAEPESQIEEVSCTQSQNDDTNNINYLFQQIKLGSYEEVKRILEKNKCEEVTSGELCHPLCSCDRCEHLILQKLHTSTPDIHSCDDKGYTALHVACMYGQPNIVDFVIECGADINSHDYSGATPLHYAAMRGHQNALLLLLHSGADVNAADGEKNTPLHFACNNGHEACIKAIVYFCEHQCNNLNMNAVNTLGDTPLHYAARWGYESIVQILLEYGANPNIDNKQKKTPLDIAHNPNITRVIKQHKETNTEKKVVVKSLKQVKKDSLKNRILECEKIHDNTLTKEMKRVELLLRAVALDDMPLVCFYLGLKSCSDFETTSDLCHPLCTCDKCLKEQNEEKELPKDILPINVANSEGMTALHMAALHGRSELALLLLRNGAAPSSATKKGLTALHLACQTQRLHIVKLLLNYDCKVDIQDVRGNTALHYACQSQDAEIVAELKAHGADPSIKNKIGNIPANETTDKTLIKILKSTGA